MEAEIVLKTTENLVLSGTKNNIPLTQQTTMVTEIPSCKNSKITTSASQLNYVIKDGVNNEQKQQQQLQCTSQVAVNLNNILLSGLNNNCEGDNDNGAVIIKNHNANVDERIIVDSINGKTVNNENNCIITEKSRNNNNINCGFPMKTKRKRRRGKPKANSKVYKKTNWKFQMPPRYHRNGNGMRSKLVRSRSIVPYNTNKFLMEEHMAEVPSALLTPSGRTRDSSFSIDSEDNYFFSLPEDEEEFLTKEFANVYEKARVERLEGLTKQQLIEECLQLEDRYAQSSGVQQNGTVELLNKIRQLEERIRDLNSENLDLRRKLDPEGKLKLQQERMCSSSSEDSESDSSSSSSSCASSEFSRNNSRRSSISCNVDPIEDNNSKMDSDDIITEQYEHNGVNNIINGSEPSICNGHNNSNYSSPSEPSSPIINSSAQQQHQQIGANRVN